MKKTWKKAIMVPAFGVALLLSACSGQGGQGAGGADGSNQNMTNKTVHDGDKNLDDASIIPSETGVKKETTNQDGKTYSGTGQDLYGSIGSSGVHEGGISSYFESILKGEGITGVHVFVIDDTVVLARAKPEKTSHEYDDMQQDVLKGTRGMSGKGDPKGTKAKGADGDNLKQARAKINDMFDGHVKILTTTDPKTTQLTKRIKKEIKDSSYKAASDDVLMLLKMTK